MTKQRTRLDVALFVPNLLCYARIILALAGQFYASDRPVSAITLWSVSASLDLFDGMLARALHQTSEIGVILDIIADNVLRTSVWVSAATVSGAGVLQVVAVAIVSLEWMTMLATQLHAAQNVGHWKKDRTDDPWFVKTFFSNNFRNPLGTLGVLGLFTANLFLYGMHFPEVSSRIPLFNTLLVLACFGRLLSVVVEFRLLFSYVGLVLDKDLVVASSSLQIDG